MNPSTTAQMNGKVAIVTGAASGIGKAIALTLAEAGARLGVTDLDAGGARSVADSIEKSGGQALGIAMDVTDEGAVNRGIDQIAEHFGGIDLLVSNAGIQLVNPIVSLSSPTGARCWPCISTAPS